MFRFTRKFSRRQIGLILALALLLTPALMTATVESAAIRTNTEATPPKKKATPTPAKTQAKTKPTPKKTPTPAVKSKTTKPPPPTSAKNKPTTKTPTKTDSKTTKTIQKNGEKNKNSKSTVKESAAKTNSKTPVKNSKTTKPTTTENKNSSSKNKPATTKNTSNQTTKTTVKPKQTTETKPKPTTPVIKTTNPNSEDLPQIIVTTLSVPLRSEAKSDARTLSNLKLGTILKVTDKNPAWYKVQFTSDGKTSNGWISANSVNDLNAARKEEIYRQIVERNYRSEMDFAAASEIYEFISGVSSELSVSDASADLELKRLLALRAALKMIPGEQKGSSPYREFLKNHDKEIVYNEPAGNWLVASNLFWDLHTKYQKSTVSDLIAWEAANNPLPGECEGYVNCHLFDIRMRFGEYLNLHPTGKNAAEALKNLTALLDPIVADLPQKAVYNGPTDVTDRAEFNNLIAELRTIISRLPFTEKEKTLQQLRKMAEGFR